MKTDCNFQNIYSLNKSLKQINSVETINSEYHGSVNNYLKN